MTFSRMECLMLLGCTAVVFGQVKKTTPPTSVVEVFDRSVDGPEHATLALAEKMPESHYSFVPTQGEFKGVRTFARIGQTHRSRKLPDGRRPAARKNAGRTRPA